MLDKKKKIFWRAKKQMTTLWTKSINLLLRKRRYFGPQIQIKRKYFSKTSESIILFKQRFYNFFFLVFVRKAFSLDIVSGRCEKNDNLFVSWIINIFENL